MDGKWVVFFVAVAVSLLLPITVWQSFQYRRVEAEVKKLAQIHSEWEEQNRKLVTGIAVYSSPARVENISYSQLGFKRLTPEDVRLIRIKEDN